MGLEGRVLAVLGRRAPGMSAAEIAAHLDPAPIPGVLGAALDALTAERRIIRHRTRAARRHGGAERYYRADATHPPAAGPEGLFG